MSNIYVQEPPTSGKVILTTSLGEIEIELWSKECPKACKNFVQLCMEGFYNGTIFHRVVPNFIAQGGDPTGSGHGGESIYGEPFKNEIHSRLRFVRRGLVATANTGNNDNESQFFFTLGACQELQNKHTIFGRVAGNTLYNMIKFNELDIDGEERPRHPPKVIKTEVINNPFNDIEPRIKLEGKKLEVNKPKITGTKNRQLLSFADDDEEDDESLPTKLPKGKSSHELTNDPRLSKIPAINFENLSERNGLENTQSKDLMDEDQEMLLYEAHDEESRLLSENASLPLNKSESQLKLKEIKEQIRHLKREMKNTSENNCLEDTKKMRHSSPQDVGEDNCNEILIDFHEQQKKYAALKKTLKTKGVDREAETLRNLQKFQEKLSINRGTISTEETENNDDHTWFRHVLKFEDSNPTLARDANTKSDDWFEIYDPRNPINKRRREESKKIMKERGSSSKGSF